MSITESTSWICSEDEVRKSAHNSGQWYFSVYITYKSNYYNYEGYQEYVIVIKYTDLGATCLDESPTLSFTSWITLGKSFSLRSSFSEKHHSSTS